MVLDFVLGDQLAEHTFKLGHTAGEIVDCLSFGIGEASVFKNAAFRADAHDPAGYADDGRVVGDGVDNDRSGADLDVVADVDVAEDLGAGSHDHSIAESGVTFALLAASTAERDALVEQDIVSNLGSFADDDSRAVIDEEAAAECGAWVDFNPGKEAADLRDQPGDEGDAPTVEFMGEAVGQDGMKAGVAEEDFNDAFSSRVLPEDGIDLFPDGAKHQ